MLRQAISNQLKFILQMTEDLEQERTKKYAHKMDHAQVVMSLDEKAAYENLTRSIMHYEGRAKEARSILRMIDNVELRVRAGRCEHCNHHEIGTVDLDGKFTALKLGERILRRKDR